MKKIYLYKPPGEEAPFLQFLAGTEPKMRKKLRYGLRCLACFPEYMTEPHVKHFSIERYNRLYEYRERIRILVRVIFTLDENGDIILLYPFVKRHDRNTMQALEASVHIMEKIRASPDSIIEYQFEQEEKG